MKISTRETVLAFMTFAVLLYGGVALVAKGKYAEWQNVRRMQAEVLAQIESDTALLADRDTYVAEFERLSEMLTQHGADEKMDVHWLSEMQRLATARGVEINKRQVGEEKGLGDVYELPIEVKEWEGSLDAVVGFLFDLQSGGAMLDIRQLVIKPKPKGRLGGRFSLHCAYTRQAVP